MPDPSRESIKEPHNQYANHKNNWLVNNVKDGLNIFTELRELIYHFKPLELMRIKFEMRQEID